MEIGARNMEHKTYNTKHNAIPTLRATQSVTRDSSRHGFSLVETIIYVGLLAMILVGIVNMLLGMSKAYSYLKLSRNVQVSAITSIDRMVREIRNAESVNVAQSTLGTNPGVLTINTTTALGSTQIFQFHVASGVLRMKKDGTDLGPLSLSGVAVSNLVFRHMDSGISEAVKIEMTITAGTRVANFYATALLRDSY